MLDEGGAADMGKLLGIIQKDEHLHKGRVAQIYW